MEARCFGGALSCDGSRHPHDLPASDRSGQPWSGGGRRLRGRVAGELKTFSRRAAFALLAVVSTVLPAHAQGADTYPSRPITLVVPFAPSGGNDIMARLVGERMGKALGQQIVVENRPGAGGNIGSRQAARSAPDGYTMLLAFTGTIGINPSLYANLGYDPAKDLTPIGSIATSPAVLVVHPSLPVKTLKELIAYAKANPGQLSYASSGVGTVVHVATEMLADAAGVQVEQVPYKGTGPGITDLLGGHVKMMMPPIPAMLGYVNAGTLRAIGVTSKERSPLLPDVPTIEEAGLPGFVSEQRYGLLAPAGTPRPIIERLNAELRNALADEAIRKRIVDDGATPRPDSPEDYAAEIERDRALWGGIVKKLGLRVE
jgi:tripartite-type tricarboxylate transporter receptor subunit TctC